MTRDEVLDRLRKLHNLAQRAGTPGEAQAALAAAMKLATKYGIEPHELETETALYDSLFPVKGASAAAKILLSGISAMTGCYAFINGDAREFVVSGRPVDRSVCKLLVLASLDTMERQFNIAKRTKSWVQKRSFTEAFAETLLDRMYEAHNEVMDAAVHTKALAIVTPDDRRLQAAQELEDRGFKFQASGVKTRGDAKQDAASRALGADAASKTKLPGQHESIEGEES